MVNEKGDHKEPDGDEAPAPMDSLKKLVPKGADEIETLYDMVTTKAALAMGLKDFEVKVGGQAHLPAQRLHDLGKRHFIRLAYAHVDNLGARMRSHRGPFGPLDPLELVDGGGFAVL